LKNHKIIDWFGLEGTIQDHLVQTSCHGQGHEEVSTSSLESSGPLILLLERFHWNQSTFSPFQLNLF